MQKYPEVLGFLVRQTCRPVVKYALHTLGVYMIHYQGPEA